mmetsp:Transcript_54948/g.151212  ORF Transcript_54948/g.151212 Transcript_54948/m.151212 type:complete len:367 (-) Transcript_54948:127-1227(-)
MEQLQARLGGERERERAVGRLGRRRRALAAALLRLGQSLELHHHLLARKVLLVALLEVEGAVVERLGVVLLVDLLPLLGALGAQRAPLLVLLLQPLDQRVDRRRGALAHQLDDLRALRAVEPADGLAVHRRQRARQLVPPLLRLGEGVDLLLDGLEHLQRRHVRLDRRIHLEPLVLGTEDRLLVLVLAHRLEVEVLGPRGDRHPRVVEHERLERAAARSGGHRVRIGQDAVRRAVPLHRREVEVAEVAALGDGRARRLRRRRVARLAGRVAEQPAEGGEELDLGALEEVVDEREQLGAVEDLLRVEVEALEQLEVQRLRHAVAALGKKLRLRRAARLALGALALLLAVVLALLPEALLVVVLLLPR